MHLVTLYASTLIIFLVIDIIGITTIIKPGRTFELVASKKLSGGLAPPPTLALTDSLQVRL